MWYLLLDHLPVVWISKLSRHLDIQTLKDISQPLITVYVWNGYGYTYSCLKNGINVFLLYSDCTIFNDMYQQNPLLKLQWILSLRNNTPYTYVHPNFNDHVRNLLYYVTHSTKRKKHRKTEETGNGRMTAVFTQTKKNSCEAT